MAIKTEERETVMLSFIGLERCDLVYYAARLFNAADKEVLIIDNTLNHGMFHSLRKPEGEESVQVGNIFVTCNKKYSEYFFSRFDYVILYHGMNLNEELIEKSDYRYLVCDFNPFTSARLAKHLARINENLDYYLILRDKVHDKVSEKMMLSELGLRDTHVKEIFTLPYSDIDYMCYMNLLRNGSQQIKNTSADTRDCLKSIFLSVMPSLSKKEMNKYIKKAMTGKIK